LYELRELPRAIRDLGRYLREAASGSLSDPGGIYLSWKFGWAPLFSDLLSLANLAEAMEARLKALREAQREQRFGGKLPPHRSSWSGGVTRWYGGNSWVEYLKQSEYSEENWFTTSYFIPDGFLPSVSDDSISKLRWALGLNASYSTIWNAIPWSWLIDYFLSIGDFLEINRGNVKWEAYDMCIMSKGVTTVTTTVVNHQESRWISGPFPEGGKGTFEHLRRRVVVSPKARVLFRPFLTNSQLGILGALASSRTSTFLRGGGR
jgi:hypothetical protein